MNGPEHYAEAERLIESATFDHNAGPGAGNAREADVALALAQVHATLALAAATAADRWVSPVRDYGGHDVVTGQGWAEVAR